VAVLLVLVLAVYVHFSVRHLHAARIGRGLGADVPHLPTRESLRKAFARNTRPWRSVFFTRPVGWGRRARSRLAEILAEADRYVQTLNDRFTNPSGLAPSKRLDDGALALEPRPAASPPVTVG
jgi:hypothetical protein